MRVSVSNPVKLVVLVCIIAIFVVGISIGGPKFVNFVQMQFGSKGKIDLIEKCIEMPGCSIGPEDLDFYERYRTVRESDAAQKIRESEAGEKMLKE